MALRLEDIALNSLDKYPQSKGTKKILVVQGITKRNLEKDSLSECFVKLIPKLYEGFDVKMSRQTEGLQTYPNLIVWKIHGDKIKEDELSFTVHDGFSPSKEIYISLATENEKIGDRFYRLLRDNVRRKIENIDEISLEELLWRTCSKVSLGDVLPYHKIGGKISPVYFDVMSLLYDEGARDKIISTIKGKIRSLPEYKKCVAAGAEVKGVSFGAILAYELDLPFVILRDDGRIQTPNIAGKKVILFDDVVATGKTVRGYAKRIKDAESELYHAQVVLDLGLMDVDLQKELHYNSLTTFEKLLAVPEEIIIKAGKTKAEMHEIQSYATNSAAWIQKHS